MNLKAYLLITLVCLVGAIATVFSIRDFQNDIKSRTTLTAKEDLEKSDQTQNTNEVQIRDAKTPRTKFEEFLSNGNTFTCQLETVEDGDLISGEFFVKGQNLRGNFRIQSDEGNATTDFLKLDSNVYVWTDANGQGYKTQVDSTRSLSSIEELNYLTKNPNLSCIGAEIADTTFALPENIQFIDLTKGIQSVLEDKEQLCSLCKNAPTAAEQSACEAQFDC